MFQLLAARCLPLPAEEVGWTKQGWGRERAPLEGGGEEEGGMGRKYFKGASNGLWKMKKRKGKLREGTCKKLWTVLLVVALR